MYQVHQSFQRNGPHQDYSRAFPVIAVSSSLVNLMKDHGPASRPRQQALGETNEPSEVRFVDHSGDTGSAGVRLGDRICI